MQESAGGTKARRKVMAKTKERTERPSGGGMTVREAGRKGGEVTAQRHGPQFYEEIGRKGGQKVKQLIEQGKRAQRGSENEA
jgi:general stress protein YciG